MNLVRLLIVTIALILAALSAIALFQAGALYVAYTWLLAQIMDSTGFDLWASRALSLAILAVVLLTPWQLAILPWVGPAKRQVASLFALAAVVSAAMIFLTQEVYFSRTDGRPLKYYIRTAEGFRFAAVPGTDPQLGIPYKRVTADIAKQHLLSRHRGPAKDPTPPEGRYFDPATGEPLRWYARTPEGRIEFFPLPGYHPTYGTKLLAATTPIVAEHEKQEAELNRQRQAETERARQAEVEDTRRKAQEESDRQARETKRKQAAEAARLKQPLESGRYIVTPPPEGRIDVFLFRLTEVDLTGDKLMVHLAVENPGPAPSGHTLRHIRFTMALPDGTIHDYQAIRPKEGELEETNDRSFHFPSTGRRGAFVMEYARPENLRTFSVLVNDQPLFSGLNLRQARFQSF